QTLEAADNGLSAITKTLESMQSTLRQARQDKSFQTDSFSLDPETIGIGLQRTLDFTSGAFETPGSISLHKNVVVGQNGFVNGGTAGKAGTLEIETDSLNGGTPITVAFTAADTVDTFAAKINAHISTLSDKGGVSARVVNGQLEIASSKAEAITVSGTELEYIGMGGTDETATPATRDGSSAVAAGALGAFSFTINGLTVNVGATAAANTATQNGDAIRDAINNSAAAQAAGVVATNNAGVIELANADGKNFTLNGTGLTTMNMAAGATTDGIPASGTAVPPGTGSFVVKTVDELVREINRDADLKTKIRASNDNGRLRIENLSTQELDIAGVTSSGIIDGTSFGAASITGNSIRADLAGQFNELRDQLDKLSDDASFNGINLLRGDNLKITFNENGTSSIDIQTKNGDAL